MLLFSFSEIASADVVYISVSDDLSTVNYDHFSTINYIEETASGDFQVTYNILPMIPIGDGFRSGLQSGYSGVFAFTSNVRKRLFVISNDEAGIYAATYDTEDFSHPLASREISSLGFSDIDSIVSFGNNILIGGGDDTNIVELNPDTLEVVGESYNYILDNGAPANGSELFVHNDTIYDAIPYSYSISLPEGKEILIMNKAGNITGRIRGLIAGDNPGDGFFNHMIASSGGKLYISTFRSDYPEKGIYRIEHDTIKNMDITSTDLFQKYAVRVVSGDVNGICSDGNEGLYYCIEEGEDYGSNLDYTIRHWDGKEAEIIFNFNVSELFGSTESAYQRVELKFDSSNKTLFVKVAYNGYIALKQDVNGQYKAVQQFDLAADTSRWYCQTAIIPSPQDVSPDIPNSGSGGCNSLSLSICALLFLLNKKR